MTVIIVIAIVIIFALAIVAYNKRGGGTLESSIPQESTQDSYEVTPDNVTPIETKDPGLTKKTPAPALRTGGYGKNSQQPKTKQFVNDDNARGGAISGRGREYDRTDNGIGDAVLLTTVFDEGGGVQEAYIEEEKPEPKTDYDSDGIPDLADKDPVTPAAPPSPDPLPPATVPDPTPAPSYSAPEPSYSAPSPSYDSGGSSSSSSSSSSDSGSSGGGGGGGE